MGISMRRLLRFAPPACRNARCAALAKPAIRLAIFAACSPPLAAHAQSLPGGPSNNPLDDIRLQAGYRYDNNVNRAPNGEERLSEQFFTLNATQRILFPIDSPSPSRVLLDVKVGGDLTRSFPKLGRVFGEIQPSFQYRKSADFYSPTIGVAVRMAADHFGSSQRSGYRYSAEVSILQPVTDRMNLFGSLAENWRNANSRVFDGRDTSVQVTADYRFDSGRLYVGGEYRRGDVVSTGPESLVNLDLAKVFVADDAYTNPQLFSYRFDANTVIGTLGYNLPLGRTSALDVSWKIAQSTPTHGVGFAGTSHYVDNQFMVVYSLRF
jgi:hypothetical protein